MLTAIRQSTDHNTQGVEATQRAAETLLARAQSLVAIVEPSNGDGARGNGRL
jgi:hypothetical protein